MTVTTSAFYLKSVIFWNIYEPHPCAYSSWLKKNLTLDSLLYQMVGLFIISNDTKCTLLFSLAIIGDAFWIVNSEND